MRILMVSIFAPHFFNWTEQLKNSGYEIYWLDVFDSNTKVEKIDFVNQIIGWRYRWDFPGRYLLKEKAPNLTNFINRFNERSFQKVLEKKIHEIKPDVVHSFVIYLSAAPAVNVMNKFPKIKWVLSTWGSDLYYYQNKKSFLLDIQKVLPKIDYLFTDCKRDHQIAMQNGFQGHFLGVFPGGGGYDLNFLSKYIFGFDKRNTIMIKGYQGKHGRCIELLKSLCYFEKELKGYEIVIYGADKEVLSFANNSEIGKWKNLKILGKIPRIDLLKLMGKAKISIGNSLSDGMPNTLLEAIVMQAFPVQSNPGGVTEEIIENGFNGLLIKDPDSISSLRISLEQLFYGKIDLIKAIEYNTLNIKPLLSRDTIREEVLKKYKLVEEQTLTGN